MAKTETLTVEVPEELVAAMRGAVHDGDSLSDDEVISDALTRWNENRTLHDEDTARIRAAVQEAIAEGGYLSVEEVFEPLKARYQEMIDAEYAKECGFMYHLPLVATCGRYLITPQSIMWSS
jgi:Arc/MetJ-type ribon-helix-helix transcriptional regulator